jgi:hypothetical protein
MSCSAPKENPAKGAGTHGEVSGPLHWFRVEGDDALGSAKHCRDALLEHPLCWPALDKFVYDPKKRAVEPHARASV